MRLIIIAILILSATSAICRDRTKNPEVWINPFASIKPLAGKDAEWDYVRSMLRPWSFPSMQLRTSNPKII